MCVLTEIQYGCFYVDHLIHMNKYVDTLKSVYALIVLIGYHITYTIYFENNKFGYLGHNTVQCPID